MKKHYFCPQINEECQQRHQLSHAEEGTEDGQPPREVGGEVAGGDVDEAGEEDKAAVDEVEDGGDEEEGHVKVVLLLVESFFCFVFNLLKKI